MRLRAALAALLATALVLPVQGCTRTIEYAVVNPQAAPDGGQCFQNCQLLRPAGTKSYLACVQTCPGTHVTDGAHCGEVAYDAARFECRTEHNQTFDPTVGILLIFLGVIAVVVIGASQPSQQQTP